MWHELLSIENTSLGSIGYIEHNLNGRKIAAISNGLQMEELKALAYWERKTIEKVIDEALRSY